MNTTSLQNEEDSKRRINDIIEKSQANKYVAPNDTEIPDNSIDDFDYNQGAGRLRQMYLITKRSWMNTQRQPSYLVGRFVQSLIMGLCIAILWWQIDNDQLSIQDRLGVTFITLLGSAFPEAVTASLVCK